MKSDTEKSSIDELSSMFHRSSTWQMSVSAHKARTEAWLAIHYNAACKSEDPT